MRRRTNQRKQPKRRRRTDEASLYFLIERDLDREFLFPDHDGWYSQIGINKSRIDYAIRYDDLVFGVEVKSSFPKPSHFQQVIYKYRRFFDATYLAYPSDRAAEAFSVRSRRHEEFSKVGIISIALYRTHCIRRAYVLEREDETAWNVFDEHLYREEIEGYIKKGNVRNIDAILSEESTIRFSNRDWKSLAVLLGMYQATSIDKFHSVDTLQKKQRRDLKWKGYVNYLNLLNNGFVFDRSYGAMMSLFSLSHEAYYRKKRIRRRAKEEIGLRKWEQLIEQSKLWKSEHRAKQKQVKQETLRF